MTVSLQIPPPADIEDDDPPKTPTSDAPLLFDGSPSISSEPSKSWVYLVICFCVLVAFIDLGAFVFEPPLQRLYESIICLHHYQRTDPSKIHNGTVDEQLCKGRAVQDKLVTILGWQDLWGAIPGILLAIPYGALADKHGRKWIFILSLVGIILGQVWMLLVSYFQFDLRLTWFSSAFTVLGGGPVVTGAVGLTMIADVCPADKQMTIFLYFQAIILGAEMVAPALASALMNYGNWLPLLGGLAVESFAITFALIVPETLHQRNPPGPRLDVPSHPESDDDTNDKGHGWRVQMQHFRDAISFLKRDFSLALVVFSFLVNRLGRQSLSRLLQYASKRYSWPIKRAALLLSLRAGTNLIVLLVIIPAFSLFLLKYLKYTPQQADLSIARVCMAFTAVAFVVMGFSFTPPLLMIGLILYNLGTGFTAALRSIAIFMVGGHQSPDIARLFAVIAIMEGFGAMLSGPLLAQLFSWGMQLGTAFLGLPFVFSGVLCALVGIVLSLIRLRDLTAVRAEDESLILNDELGRYRDESEHVDDSLSR